MSRHYPNLSLNNTAWTINISNFPPGAPSPTRRMSVQFVLNNSPPPMRSDDHESLPHQFTSSSEPVTNQISNVKDSVGLEADSRSPTPVFLVPTGSPTSLDTQPHFKRRRKAILPKSSAPQEEDLIEGIRTRAQRRATLGVGDNTQPQKRRFEQEEQPRKRHAKVLDVETPQAPRQEEDKSAHVSIPKPPEESQSTTKPTAGKESASRVRENREIDSRYDRSALTYQNGEYWAPRACSQSFPTHTALLTLVVVN